MTDAIEGGVDECAVDSLKIEGAARMPALVRPKQARPADRVHEQSLEVVPLHRLDELIWRDFLDLHVHRGGGELTLDGQCYTFVHRVCRNQTREPHVPPPQR